MKPTALLVNTSRAGLIEPGALVGALRAEWEIQFADVFDQINAYATGTPANVVNPEVLTHARP
jgi:D-3-phosphoglycerate dehydrogenase